MAINRFDTPIDYTPRQDYVSQAVPMPFNELLYGVQQRQKTADSVRDVEEEAENFLNVAALPTDTERRNKKIDEYESSFSSALDEVEGDYSQLKGFARNYAKTIQKDLTRGELAAIKRSHDNYTAYVKDLNTALEKGTITSDKAKKLRNMALAKYEGIGEKDELGNYNSFKAIDPAKDVNIAERAVELVEKFATQGTAWHDVDEGVRRTFNQEYRKSGDVQKAAMTALMLDPEVNAYLEQEADIDTFYNGANLDSFGSDVAEALRAKYPNATEEQLYRMYKKQALIQEASGFAGDVMGFNKTKLSTAATPEAEARAKDLIKGYSLPEQDLTFKNPYLSSSTYQGLIGEIAQKENLLKEELSRLNNLAGQDPKLIEESNQIISRLKDNIQYLRTIKQKQEKEYTPSKKDKELFETYGEVNPLVEAAGNVDISDPGEVSELLKLVSSPYSNKVQASVVNYMESKGSKNPKQDAINLINALHKKEKVIDDKVREDQYRVIRTSFKMDNSKSSIASKQNYLETALPALRYIDKDGNVIDGSDTKAMEEAGINLASIQYGGYSDLPIPGTGQYAWKVNVHGLDDKGKKSGIVKSYHVEAPKEFIVEKALIDGNMDSFKTYITQNARVKNIDQVPLGQGKGTISFVDPITGEKYAGGNEFVYVGPNGKAYEVDSNPAVVFNILQKLNKQSVSTIDKNQDNRITPNEL